MADKGKQGEATFRVTIDGNASVASKDIASNARLAAGAIEKFENEAKVLSGELRRLRGNSDEVNATKAALKKRIDEVRTSVSALTVDLAKQGTTYGAVSASVKKYGNNVGRLPNLKRGLSAAFGPLGQKLAPTVQKAAKALEPVGKKLSVVKKAFVSVGKVIKEDVGSVLPSASSMLGAVATGAELAAAAGAAAGLAFIGAGVAVAAFGIASAAAASKMQLQRQAILGNAKDAKALGEQIDVLAGKVPQGTAELNEMGRELSKTRLTSKAIVDTMNAVAQATGAVDASAGAKIQELITRGQASGRFFLQQLELQGTGIDFEDVATAYAEATHKGIAAARKELSSGESTLEAGAAALRKATEKKFGDINLKNAFSLENAPKKLKEQLNLLSSGVDLTPISKGLQYAFGQLAPEAQLGAAIKTFMETFGTGLVDIAGKSIPVLVEGFKWMLVWALKLGTAYYQTVADIKKAFEGEDWVSLGLAIPKGIAKGIFAGYDTVAGAVIDTAKNIKNAFTGALKIQSPSKVFEKYGRFTTEGYAQGVQSGSQKATSAVQNMVDMPQQSSGSSSGPINIEVNIHGAPTNDAQAMSSPDFLAQLTRAIRDAVAAKGLVAA